VADAAPVLVVVSVDPETSHRANEAVRIALGILAGENAVTVVLVGPGVKVLDAAVEDYVDGEDLLRHLQTLRRLGQTIHVERAAIGAGTGWNPAGMDVHPIGAPELAGLVTRARRVLVF
jgi:predicted peroxiredoxin